MAERSLQMRPKALRGYPEITLELWRRDIIASPEALTRTAPIRDVFYKQEAIYGSRDVSVLHHLPCTSLLTAK